MNSTQICGTPQSYICIYTYIHKNKYIHIYTCIYIYNNIYNFRGVKRETSTAKKMEKNYLDGSAFALVFILVN